MKEAAPYSTSANYPLAPLSCGDIAWQAASDAMVLSDVDGNVITANPAYFELYGYPPEEIINKEFSIIFPEEEREAALRLYKKIFMTGDLPEVVEATIQRYDGTRRIVESRAQFIYEDGAKSALLSIVRDITDRKLAEQKLQAAHNELIETNKALKQANADQKDILGIVAHDLKNPLGLIKNLSKILLHEANGNVLIEEISQQIFSTSENIMRLITELLEMTKIDSGKISLHREKTALCVLVKNIIAVNQAGAAQKGQQIIAMLEENCHVQIDATLIRQAVDNLISNAIKFSPRGKEIFVRVESDKNFVRVVVADQGPGLSDEDKEKIFGKFQKLSAMPTADEPSSGLGLYLVKRIIELHGGKISADSKGLGMGTTFLIELPR